MSERACDHVAVLVEDLEQALGALGALAEQAQAIEEFPSEGTREVYVGTGRSRLLLLQAIGPGPYLRALEARGPGVHHLAFHAPEPRQQLAALPGWLLHPHSLESQPQTLWAARPGLPLVELSTGTCSGEPLLTALELAVPAASQGHLDPFAALGLPVSPGPRTRITWSGGTWEP